MSSTGFSSNLPMLPVLIPFITGIILFFLYKNVKAQKVISGISSIAMIIAAVFLLFFVRENGQIVFCASGWSAPFGIVLTMDLLSCIMVVLSSIVSCMCLFFSFKTIDKEREKHFYYILWQFLLMGIQGSFVTGDLFNLYVFFEIMLLASYILLILGNSKGQLREGFKYLVINLFSSTLFLVGLGLLYSTVGTMNMADIAMKIGQVENQGMVTLIAMIFMVVFGIKGALFPLFFWLPDSYTKPPAAVSAFFGGMLTKVGVYALIRVFTLIFVGDTEFTHTILLIIAGATMLLGVIGALSRMRFKSILSYHVISQVGYMVMGLGLFSVYSIAGAIFYIAHHIIVKSSLFLLEGVTEKTTGTDQLKDMGGLLNTAPILGWTFLIAGLSLAGVPPLSGFFSKFILMQDAAMQGEYWIMIVAIVVGFLTLFSMMKIFIYVFWGKEKPVAPQVKFSYKKMMPVCIIMVGLSVLMGLFAQPMVDLAMEASTQIMDPTNYINAVMSINGGR